jgi:hypothetical protein
MSDVAAAGVESTPDSVLSELNNDQLIQLLSIYSDRENFQISQHQARANFYIGLVISGLTLACIAWAQYRGAVDRRILVLVPFLMIAVAELAIASLRRTFVRVNENMATRYSIEQLIGLQKPTRGRMDARFYYFPGEPIRPVDSGFVDWLRKRQINKANYARFTSNIGQQLYLKVIFRVLQLFSLVLAGLFILG